jgi:hypothetical protein
VRRRVHVLTNTLLVDVLCVCVASATLHSLAYVTHVHVLLYNITIYCTMSSSFYDGAIYQEKKKYKQATRAQKIKEYFEKVAKSKLPKSATEKKCPRWLPKKSEAAKAVTMWLEKHLPPTIKLVCDDYNGRWRVIFEAELIWRSVSWTKRGYAKAASLVLHTAWTFHFDATGEQPEFDIDELEKDFAEAEE